MAVRAADADEALLQIAALQKGRHAGPDYQRLLAAMQRGKMALDRITRFDMPGWRPSPAYVREMKRYGALPTDFDPANDPIKVYETDERYWGSFWYSPPAPGAGGALSDAPAGTKP